MGTNNKNNDTSRADSVEEEYNQYKVTLNNAINSAGSLQELEGIRHEVKNLLEKLEEKINCALVKKALDEFDSSNQHSNRQPKTNENNASRQRHQNSKKREDAASKDEPKQKKRRPNESSHHQSIGTRATQHNFQKESLGGPADSVNVDEIPAGASEIRVSHLITVLYKVSNES